MGELFYPGAVQRPGPPSKQGYGSGQSSFKRGEVKHSAEGYWDGLYSVLDNLSIPSSWHFTVGYDRVEQHYSLEADCWHANDTDPDGLVRGNFALVGIEHLGVAGEPLTPYQVTETIALSRWMAAQQGLPAFGRYPAQFKLWTLAEHNQVGNDPTACPSGRIPWEVIMTELNANAGTSFELGNQQNGLELRGLQQVHWLGGVEVLALGDPEGVGLGRLAKNFGPEQGPERGDIWYWLRKGPGNIAYWSTVEGD